MTLRTSHLTAAGLGAVTDAIRIARDQLAPSPVSGSRRRDGGFDEALSRNGAESAPVDARLTTLQYDALPTAPAEATTATELAIQGDGYLAVMGDVAGSPGTYFVQRAQFRTNVNGSLVTAGNLALLGRPTLPDGSFASRVAPLNVRPGAMPARESTQLSITANLDASTAVGDGTKSLTEDLRAEVEIFDRLGRAQNLRLHFSKAAEGEWQYRASVDARQVELAPSTGDVVVGKGSLHFSGEGLLQAHTPTQTLDVTFQGAGGGQRIELGFGDAIAEGGSGLAGTTQFNMPSAVGSTSHDGHAVGTTSGFGVLPDGTVEAHFSNGQRQPIGQVVVAQFRDNQLAHTSDGVFTQTQDSGQAVLGGPGRNGRGTVAFSREVSTLDSSEEPVVASRPQRTVTTNVHVMAAASDMLSRLQTSTVWR
jgi:flagellar hook protein FlgE